MVSTTGPIVLEMIRGPAAMIIGWYQMFSGKARRRGAVAEAVEVPLQMVSGWIGPVEVARPDRKDLPIGDGQAHLVAVAERGVGLRDWPPTGYLTPAR